MPIMLARFSAYALCMFGYRGFGVRGLMFRVMFLGLVMFGLLFCVVDGGGLWLSSRSLDLGYNRFRL